MPISNFENENVNGSLPTAAESIDQPTDSPEVKLYQVVVAANFRMSLNQDRPLLCMDDPTPAAEEMTLEQREQEILEALKQDDWKTACEELGYVDFEISETVSDAYYDRRWQGIVMFFGMVLGEPIEEDLDDFYGSTAAIKAIDAATAPTELLLEESEI